MSNQPERSSFVIPEVDRFVDYKPALFVNDLLRTLERERQFLPETTFRSLVSERRDLDEGAIRTAMVRTIDESGYIANLIGWVTNPQETLNMLRNMGEEQLEIIHDIPDTTTKEEVWDTLRGLPATLRAILILDERQKDIMDGLTILREDSEDAMAVRQANIDAVQALYKNTSALTSPVLDNIIPIGHQKLIKTQGIPRIYYKTKTETGNVTEVWRCFYYPNIWKVYPRGKYGDQSVGQILYNITPPSYRHVKIERRLNPDQNPHDLMLRLGIVGDRLLRVIIDGIKSDPQLKHNIIQYGDSLNDASERIKDMVRSH